MSSDPHTPIARITRHTDIGERDLFGPEDAERDVDSSAANVDFRLDFLDQRLNAMDRQIVAILESLNRVQTQLLEASHPAKDGQSSPDIALGADPPRTEGSIPDRVARIVDSIESGRIPAETISDRFPPEVTGLSGRKFRTLVAQLVSTLGHSGHYLEIGTFQGKTICTSAALNPQVRHIGVDNFSYGAGQENLQILNQLAGELNLTNLEIFEADFFNWLPEKSQSGSRDIAVYYFDASHDYRSQLLALLHGAKIVQPHGVMIVDDCNYSHVRAATYDFCELHPDWALLFERYTQGHPNLANEAERQQMDEGWWNGVHLLVHDPDHLVARLERQSEPLLERFFLEQHRIENCVTERIVSRRAPTHVYANSGTTQA